MKIPLSFDGADKEQIPSIYNTGLTVLNQVNRVLGLSTYHTWLNFLNRAIGVLDVSSVNVVPSDVQWYIKRYVDISCQKFPMSQETFFKIREHFGISPNWEIDEARLKEIFFFNDYKTSQANCRGGCLSNLDNQTRAPRPIVYMAPVKDVKLMLPTLRHEIFHWVSDMYMYLEQQDRWNTQWDEDYDTAYNAILLRKYKGEVMARIEWWDEAHKKNNRWRHIYTDYMRSEEIWAWLNTGREDYYDEAVSYANQFKNSRVALYNLLFDEQWKTDVTVWTDLYPIYEVYCRSLSFFITEADSVELLKNAAEILEQVWSKSDGKSSDYFLSKFLHLKSDNIFFQRFQQRVRRGLSSIK